jgi:WD40 repeat protein
VPTFLPLILQKQAKPIMSALFSSNTTAATNTQGDTSKDVALVSPPDDSISDIKFSPLADYIAVASWDKKVRIYEINSQGQSEGKAAFDLEGPVFNCAWSSVSSPAMKSPCLETNLIPGWKESCRSWSR